MINEIPRIQSEYNFELMRKFAPGEKELIKKCFDRAKSKLR